jgi:UDP-glucose:(heptosyl)LPS alpha-1,3-glucosyltransferase
MRLAVCFQHVDPGRGGAETYVADLCRALAAAGHGVDLLAESWSAGPLPEDLHWRRIECRGGASSAVRIWDFAARCESWLHEEAGRYDCTVGLINTWGQDVLIPQGGVRAASLAASALRFPAGPLRWAFLAEKHLNPRWWVYRAIERRRYDPARASVIVAVSHLVRRHLARYHGVDPRRVRVIPNAVDPGRLAVDDAAGARRAFRARLDLRDTDCVALFAGHNPRLKGLGPLLHAMRQRMRNSRHERPMHLVVCGGGGMRPFRRLAARLGLGALVHFAGFLPDIRAAYHGSDVFVLPTYYDPCSLVVFEALACGLPVVTTRCNGAGELIEPGREGFVIDRPDDLSGLAEALDALTDDATRRRMAEAAVSLGRAQTFERHVARLLGVFEEVAALRRTSGRRPHTIAPRREIQSPC